ncbi:MAG: phosphodiester glycosidase family protein [Bacteroidales bacterium]|nr:phosphodiester glycosidase family protein [Bacteroidales bacterium]
MKHFEDIKDDEIRIISRQEVKRKPLYRRWWFWAAIAAALVSLAVILALSIRHQATQPADVEETAVESAPLSPTMEQTGTARVMVRDTAINDVPLRLQTPVNAVPELQLGIPDTTNSSLVLALQAADIRADNHKIVGAYVLKGELLSRGVAKKGFCAILDGKIQLGMAESTPLLEEATNKDGYFFRQYPLVSQGTMIENTPKNKALRHALCELNGQIVVVSSLDKESFHDFAQALADLGVQNAIALVGGQAYGFRHDPEEGFHSWGGYLTYWKKQPEVNFIVWRAKE